MFIIVPHIPELDVGNIYGKSQLTWGCKPMSLSLHLNPPLDFQSFLHNTPVISHHVLSPYAHEIPPFYSDHYINHHVDGSITCFSQDIVLSLPHQFSW